MRASGVNAARARYMEAGTEKKLRAIGIARIAVARISGFYCITVLFHHNSFKD